MMTALSILRDVEEAFFRCAVCLISLPSPLMMSCYHPYCQPCLESIIETSTIGLVCPVCGEDCDIPDNGIEGFGAELRVEYTYQTVKFQQSLLQDEVGMCAGCEVDKMLVSYCFYCKCFLCSGCYQVHLTSKMFYDHRPYIINLKNISAVENILAKLVSVTEGHRCAKHRHIGQNMCHGCGKEPVCTHATARRIVERKQKSITQEAKQDDNQEQSQEHTKTETAPEEPSREQIEKRMRELEEYRRKEREKIWESEKNKAQDNHDDIDRELALWRKELTTNGDGGAYPKTKLIQSEHVLNDSAPSIDENIEDRVKALEDRSREEAEKVFEYKRKEAQAKHDEIERELASRREELMIKDDGDTNSKTERNQSGEQENDSAPSVDEKIGERVKATEERSREETEKIYNSKKEEAQEKYGGIEDEEHAARTEEVMNNDDGDAGKPDLSGNGENDFALSIDDKNETRADEMEEHSREGTEEIHEPMSEGTKDQHGGTEGRIAVRREELKTNGDTGADSKTAPRQSENGVKDSESSIDEKRVKGTQDQCLGELKVTFESKKVGALGENDEIEEHAVGRKELMTNGNAEEDSETEERGEI